MSPLYSALICSDDQSLKEICLLMSNKQISPEYDDEFLLALFIKNFILKELFNQPITTNLDDLLDAMDAYAEEDTLIGFFLRCLMHKKSM